MNTSVATSERNCSAARSDRAVQLRALALAELERHFELDLRLTARAAQRDAALPLPEAHELCVRSRSRREALRADVQRFEQVRLPRAVRPDSEHEPRLQVEVEARVRANVAKRDSVDDQVSLAAGSA